MEVVIARFSVNQLKHGISEWNDRSVFRGYCG